MNAISAEAKFRRAMEQAGRRPASAPVPVAPLPALRKGDVHVGDLTAGGDLGISLSKLLQGRLLIQGASGAGKSWTLRRLLEQTTGLVQQIVIDPEGEFKTLVDELEMLSIDGSKLDAAAIANAILKNFDAKAYFGGCSKPQLLNCIGDALGPDKRKANEKTEKGALAKFCTKALPETGWLPPELRTSLYKGPAPVPAADNVEKLKPKVKAPKAKKPSKQAA